MRPFTTLTARTCPLPLANVDTDQLIPARFMRRTRKEGYGGQLLHDLRFTADGAPIADFPLNNARFSSAEILVARRNFGSGSSREAAVYALQDFGFRAVIAPSFGDIFAQNAVNNGLVPAKVSESDAEALLSFIADTGGDVTVDLAATSIRAGNHVIPFAIDPVWRTKLLNGWDDLDLTLSHKAEIQAFFARDAALRPWVRPRVPAQS
jgi:3-isopropylmalate/(R)-2-methylmalate dehydratase small subunit